MSLAIVGIGCIGGFGTGQAALMTALRTGPPPHEPVAIDTVAGQLTVPGFRADTAPLKAVTDRRFLRRTDPFSRMALLAGHLALADARDRGLIAPPFGRLGILVGTGYGATCNTFDFEGLTATPEPISPIRFSNSVHNAAAAHLAAFFDAPGPCLTINQLDMSVIAALSTADLWLREGRCDAVLVGGVDAFSYVAAYHRHSGGMETDTPVVGEGGAFFVLTSGGGGERLHARIDAIETGRVETVSPPSNRDGEIYITAEGPPDPAGLIPSDARRVSYERLYGRIPVGVAFDLAIAALSIGAGCLFSPDKPGRTEPLDPATGKLRCFRAGADGQWGRITVRA